MKPQITVNKNAILALFQGYISWILSTIYIVSECQCVLLQFIAPAMHNAAYAGLLWCGSSKKRENTQPPRPPTHDLLLTLTYSS